MDLDALGPLTRGNSPPEKPFPRVTGKRAAEVEPEPELDVKFEVGRPFDADVDRGGKRARFSAAAPADAFLTPAPPRPPEAWRADVQRSFMAAVLGADVAAVQRALLAGADVDLPLSDTLRPALHYVAERPALAGLLGTLMAARPNVQAGADHVGPLLLAVSVGNGPSVRALLVAGANPLHACGEVTPYHLAAALREQSAARWQLYLAFAPYVGAPPAA